MNTFGKEEYPQVAYVNLESHKDLQGIFRKIDFLDLYPLSFSEYLMALGENALLEMIWV